MAKFRLDKCYKISGTCIAMIVNDPSYTKEMQEIIDMVIASGPIDSDKEVTNLPQKTLDVKDG